MTRLARPHSSGGAVVERAAIMAEGAHGTEIIAWILEHDGTAESAASQSSRGGLYGSRLGDGRAAHSAQPLRYVLPRGALSE